MTGPRATLPDYVGALAMLARGYHWSPEVLGGLSATQVSIWSGQLARIMAIESGQPDPCDRMPSSAEASTAGIEAVARIMQSRTGNSAFNLEELFRNGGSNA